MGTFFNDITVENTFNGRSIVAHALVDSCATLVNITEPQAVELGFDVTEVTQRPYVLADGRTVNVPVVGPIRFLFAGRECFTSATVMGEVACVGQVVMNELDLVVELKTGRLMSNPAHPNGPVRYAKSFQVVGSRRILDRGE